MNLYELGAEVRKIENEFDELEESEKLNGSFVEELEKRFDGVALDFETKVEHIVKWIRNLDAEETSLGEEIKRLQARKKAKENRVSGLKGWLAFCFRTSGTKKISTSIATVSLLPPRESVEIDIKHVYDWPAAAFLACVSEEVKVNKVKLKEIAGWENLPGVTKVEGQPSITIR